MISFPNKKCGQFNMVSFCTKKKPGIVVQGTPKRFDQLRVWFFIHILPKLNTELEMEIVFYKTNTQVSVELKRLVWDTLLEKFNFKRPGFSEDCNLYISSDFPKTVTSTYLRIKVYTWKFTKAL
jgi:hypothetical protein